MKAAVDGRRVSATTKHSDALITTQISPVFPSSIETSRLKLRSPDVSDTERMFVSYTQDANVAKYMVWQPHASLEVTREFIAGCVAQWSTGSAFPYIITLKTSGQLIRVIFLRISKDKPDGVEQFFTTRKSCW
jgi:RimJ/RimL family protein N-acetyltransferase